MFRSRSLVLLLFLLAFLSPAGSGLHAAQSKKKIFIVHSYDKNNVCGAPQEAGLLEELAARGLREGEALEVDRYYMRTKRINTTAAQVAAQGRLALEAIADRQPDVVVTLDDNAAERVMLPLAGGDMPVVFSGINRLPEEYNRMRRFMNRREAPGHNVTGVYEKLHVDKAFTVMKEIIPGLQKAVILVDESPTGLAIRGQVERELSGLGGELQYAVWTARDFADYRRLIQRINSDQEIGTYYPACSRLPDGSGKMATVPELTAWNLSRCLKPGVAINFDLVAMGMFGGASVDFRALGREAGSRVADILDGAPAGSLPIEDGEDYALAFNLARARQLGITVPPDLLGAADQVFTDMKLSVPLSSSRMVLVRCNRESGDGAELEQGLLAGLEAAGMRPGEGLRIDRYSLPCRRLEEAERVGILDALKQATPDLVVLLGDTAADALLPALAGGPIPLLLGGFHAPLAYYSHRVGGTTPLGPAGNVVGIRSPLEYVKTLEAAQLILPGVRRIVVFSSGSLPWAEALRNEFADELGLHRRELQFPNLRFEKVDTLEELAEGVRRYDGSDEVDLLCTLFPLGLTDARGHILEQDRVRAWLMAHQHTPGFAFSVHGVEHGVLVATAPDPLQTGRRLGAMASRILSGTPVTMLSMEKARSGGLFLNRERARQLGIQLPMDLYEAATRLFDSVSTFTPP